MADSEDFARLEQTMDGLEASIASAETMTTAFRAEMEDVSGTMRAASRDASSLGRTLGGSLKGAMSDLVLDGARASDALNGVARSLANSVLGIALRPVQDAVGGAVGGMLGGVFADGAAFSSGKVRAFANGGVVSGPTRFPMRGGQMGLMGEAGPEAIMPLTRGPDGRLGVRAQGGGGPVMVTMNVTTPDAASFARSRGQIAAQLGRALSQGRRNQ